MDSHNSSLDLDSSSSLLSSTRNEEDSRRGVGGDSSSDTEGPEEETLDNFVTSVETPNTTVLEDEATTNNSTATVDSSAHTTVETVKSREATSLSLTVTDEDGIVTSPSDTTDLGIAVKIPESVVEGQGEMSPEPPITVPVPTIDVESIGTIIDVDTNHRLEAPQSPAAVFEMTVTDESTVETDDLPTPAPASTTDTPTPQDGGISSPKKRSLHSDNDDVKMPMCQPPPPLPTMFIDGANHDLSAGETADVEDNLGLTGGTGMEAAMLRRQGYPSPGHPLPPSYPGVVEGLPAKRARVAEPDLPQTVQVLVSGVSGARVYLVGTAHFSKESCDDVSRVIQAVQPDIVMIELCKQRTNILHLDEETILQEAQNLTMERSLEIVKQQGGVQGIMYLLLLSMSAHLTKELGMAPGGEFRRAFTEAQLVPGCMVHLGDRPISITLKRALAGLSWWQKIKLGFNILTSKDTITKEEVEKCKERDLLENMLAEMAGEFPALSRVFVTERDIFLAHSLQMAADSIPLHSISDEARLEAARAGAPPPCPVVVGVVGIGHVPGIVKHWGKVTREDIRRIVRVEPPTRTERVVKLTLKLAFIGSCVYGLYRVTRGPISKLIISK